MTLSARLNSVMRTPPLRFQVRGVRFLINHNGRAVLGDDMGLGKTYQAIAWMMLHPEVRPVVIVWPSTLKFNWQRELTLHAGLRSTVLEGRRPRPALLRRKILIINYDILQYWQRHLRNIRPGLLVIDECHRIMNRTAKRTRACLAIGRRTPHILALSGTPILNHPIEFFPTLHLVAPKLFPSFWDYAFRYCKPHRGFKGRGWVFNGATNIEELHEKVSHVMIRRMKVDVMKHLPRKTRTVIPMDIDNRREYRQAREDFLTWLGVHEGKRAVKRAMGAIAFVRLGALKTIAAKGKIDSICEWVEDWRAETGQKLILFTTHTSVLEAYHEAFPNAAVIQGKTSQANRTKQVHLFQTKPSCWLLIGNIRAAGEGLTLHAASTVVFAEIGWTPGEHDQAEDRVLRIGQTAGHVDAYYFIARDTVEEKVLNAIEQKRTVCSKVIDGEERNDVRVQVLEGLMRGDV